MNFDEAINKVVKTISFSEEEYQMCLDDAAEIARQFAIVFEKESNCFINLFADLKQTASFQRGKLFDLAPDFMYYLPYKLPIKVKPIFRQLNNDNYLMLKTKVDHKLVQDGYVSTLFIQVLFTKSLGRTMAKMEKVVCGNGETARVYELNWAQAEIESRIHAYTLIAKQVLRDIDSTAEPLYIHFDFVPSPQFLFHETPLPRPISENVAGARYWIIVCSFFMSPSTSIFGKATPRWQMLKAEHKVAAKNVIRLFKLLSQKFNNQRFLDVHSQKNEIFWRVQEQGETYVNLSLSDMFMDMFILQVTIEKRCYQNLVPGEKESFENYISNARILCGVLNKYRNSSKERNISDEFDKLFGLVLED